MIIECPACSTRYDIKVDLPPEGRTVRCAKCENVWRAVPLVEDFEEEPFAAGESYGAGGDDGIAQRADAETHASGGWGPEMEEEEEDEMPSFLQSYHRPAERQGEEASPTEDPGFAVSGMASATGNVHEEEPPSQEESAGKASWFGGFMRKSQKQASASQAIPSRWEPVPVPEPEPKPDPEPAAADPLPFPRPTPGLAVQGVDGTVRSLSDARAAVRNVFASLGENRPYQAASSIQAPVTAYADTGEDDFPFSRQAESAGAEETAWDSEPAGEQDFGHGRGTGESANAGGWPEAGTAGEGEENAAPKGWLQGWQPKEQEEPQAPAQNDLDAQLRAALQAHFPSHTAPLEAAPSPGHQFSRHDEQPATEDGEAPHSEALTAFWQRPMPPPHGEPQDAVPETQADEGDLPANEVVFDERLFRELEESRELAQLQQPHQQATSREPKGTLALAAAWGLFLCVAGGLVAGLFGFREIAADALPGLAPFYRAVGMPVTVQPLIFEGVQYEWSVSDFKPVLHIKGAVFNRAHRAVDVPDLLLSIKDDDPALDKEIPASLPVEGGRIEPEQRAEFEIELVSPSPAITTVELQLRNVR